MYFINTYKHTITNEHKMIIILDNKINYGPSYEI